MTSPEYLTGNKAGISALLDKFDVFLFDCDGVLWSGDTVFPGTAATLDFLRQEKGKTVVFVTNNSTKSRVDYARKLNSMGIPATPEEVFGSSYSAAVYIARILPLPLPLQPGQGQGQGQSQGLPKGKKVFVIGEQGVEAELAAEGVTYIGGSDPAYRRDMQADDYALIASDKDIASGGLIDPDVAVVLVGLDRHINYLKLSLALHYIRQRGAVFLATNLDSTLPSAGSLFPGAGTMSAPLITMLNGRQPVSLGKPSQAMMDAIEGKFHFDRARACMVGDRANTDIRFGIDGRLGGTLGVLTGVSSRQEFVEGETRPAYYVDRLADLLAVSSKHSEPDQK